ncbi:7458_t:CDS:2 [Funneliformis geosporum]|uniref:17526_t:CDS:1 n=1 Tax=Funneliformis geosporum TaxID=1117311 RepID=A0A9W4WI97_9GLOM|nr:7458_t:CDS:2 [Funneliformis geosporum]CAI2163742.1 17526_t:CDS:2 [Funneliformis geosporum]
MGLSQWIYSLDRHYDNSGTISNDCRNILKNCVDCIKNTYFNTPELFTREIFEFVENEVPEIYSIISEFEMELKILEQQNKKALIRMETLSSSKNILKQDVSEIQEKTRVEIEWSYNAYRCRLQLFMPTFNQLIKRMRCKINEINELNEGRNMVNTMDMDQEEVDVDVEDYGE